MGCQDVLLNRDKETHFYKNSEVFIILNNIVYKAILKKKDDSIDSLGNTISHQHYIVEVPAKSITYLRVHRDEIFLYAIDAQKSLMPCELELKIPELLENSITTFFKKEDIRISKRNRWNRFLDRVIKSIQKLKV